MNWYRGTLLVGISLLVTACASPSIQRQGASYRITVPANNWTIEFPAAGLKLADADKSRPYYYLTNDKIGLTVSFDFKRATQCNSSESCRDYLAKELEETCQDKKNWRMAKVGEVFVAENMDGLVVGGFSPKQQHMNAHYVKDGLWLNVHLSKVNFRETDRELFVNFIRSIKLGQKPN
jgi:hypothetical protein